MKALDNVDLYRPEGPRIHPWGQGQSWQRHETATSKDEGNRVSIRQRPYAELDPEETLRRDCRDAHFVCDLGFERRNLWRRGRVQWINTVAQMREPAEARKACFWLREGSSAVRLAAPRDLDRAFQNWWNGSHKGPTWRKAGRNERFCLRDLLVRSLSRKWGELLVPKAGWVRSRLSRQWPEIEASSSARVTLDRSVRWHLSFTQVQPELPTGPMGATVPLDVGLEATPTTSDGIYLNVARLLSPGEARRKRRLQRKLSRQQKGSNRRSRTKLQVSKLFAKEVARRKDWIEKTTATLVRDYDLIAVEELRAKNMLRCAKGTLNNPGRNLAQKAGLNRAILSQAWSLFRMRLEDKPAHATSPALVIAANPRFTLQTLPKRGKTTGPNRKSQAVFGCTTCGYEANKDINGARNIIATGPAAAGRRGTPRANGQSGPMKPQPPSGLVA